MSYRKVAVFKASRAVSTDAFLHGARPYETHLEKTLIDSAPFARVYPHARQVRAILPAYFSDTGSEPPAD